MRADIFKIGIKHPVHMQNLRNMYLVRTASGLRTSRFPWNYLDADAQELILRRSGTRCEPYHRRYNAYWPQALRPPQLPTTFGNSELPASLMRKFARPAG